MIVETDASDGTAFLSAFCVKADIVERQQTPKIEPADEQTIAQQRPPIAEVGLVISRYRE